jgi:O-antigen ligase
MPMALSDLVTEGLDRPVAAIRRYAISLAVAIVAVVGAVIYAASALLLALEAVLGPIGARAALAGILLAVAIAGYFAPRMLPSPTMRKQKAVDTELEGLSRDQRIAMVFEALMLGFSMGSRKPAENADGRK